MGLQKPYDQELGPYGWLCDLAYVRDMRLELTVGEIVKGESGKEHRALHELKLSDSEKLLGVASVAARGLDGAAEQLLEGLTAPA